MYTMCRLLWDSISRLSFRFSKLAVILGFSKLTAILGFSKLTVILGFSKLTVILVTLLPVMSVT